MRETGEGRRKMRVGDGDGDGDEIRRQERRRWTAMRAEGATALPSCY